MKAAATDPHEYQANYLYSDGLTPWFAAASLCNTTGSLSGRFRFRGEEWEVTLSYQESGLAPPESGETPAGTPIEFETLREYRLNAVAQDDDLGEKKVKSLIQPRWKGLQSTSGRDAARPLWAMGDAVNVRVNAANVEFDDIQTVICRAAGAVGIDPDHFSNRNDEYSVVTDAARYVRIDKDESGPIHAREGPIARMGHLLETDREGYRELKQNDTKREGYMHTATLGPGRVRECFPDHEIPREIKHYYAKQANRKSEDNPLAHPKLEASYQVARWDETIRPDDHDRLTSELEETILAVLNESGLPTQPIDGDPGGGTFVEDAYFEPRIVDRSRILQLNLERVESDQRNVVVRQLADGLSPVEWGSLQTLVSDGGEVSPTDIAEEHDFHPDSVRRGLRRIEDLVTRERGSVSLRSHYVAEQVVDALETARESVQNALGVTANAVENAERKALDDRTDELIAFCQANGIHIDEREAQLRIRMGDISGESWRDLLTRLKRFWTAAGRDLGRFRQAETSYRDENGHPKIRSVESAFSVGYALR